MKKIYITGLLMMIMTSLLQAVSGVAASEPDWRKTKMMWAHCVGWGSNQDISYDTIYDDNACWSRPLNDRTLSGKYVQCDNGIWNGTRRQIRQALEYGFDGFCVDLLSNFVSNMSRFYRAAEGTHFKIALCVDGGFTQEKLLKELEALFVAYEKHPNSCLIDGKMVVFIYTKGVPLDMWKKVIDELAVRGHYGYWLARPINEGSMWNDMAMLKAYLEVFDGFYDFGRNGFTLEEQEHCIANAWKAIRENKPEAMYVGGITPGYLSSFIGFYRPFQNTGTLRDNWLALIHQGASWACITTWNDYVEHTHFEPSAINRDILCRLNLEYCNQWRGTLPVRRPAAPFFGYHECLPIGMDFTLDITSPIYSEDESTVFVRILSIKGEVLHEFPSMVLDGAKLDYHQLRVKAEEMRDWHDGFRVQVAVTVNGKEPVWRELAPVALCYGRSFSLRTQRIAWDEMCSGNPTLTIRETANGAVADIKLHAWNLAGTLEVYCNGWPVGQTEFSVGKKPEHVVSIPIHDKVGRHLHDFSHFFVARVIGTSDQVAWSAPVVIAPDKDAHVNQPVIVTGNDMEEDWPIWSKRVSRNPKNIIEYRDISAAEMYHYAVDFSQPFDNLWLEESHGRFPVKNGAQHRQWYMSKPENQAQTIETDGPDGKKSHALHFDGNDMVALPSRTAPYGPYTLTMMIRPSADVPDCKQVLFTDANGTCQLFLEKGLVPKLAREKNGTTGGTDVAVLETGKWQLLKAVYTGNSLQLFLNGKKIAEEAVSTTMLICNSLPNIGAEADGSNGFRGDILYMTMSAGVEE